MADEPLIIDTGEQTGNGQPERRSQYAPRRPRPQGQQQRRSSQDFNQSGDDYPKQGGRFQARRKVCSFCADKAKTIIWKDVGTLRRYINSNGSIRPRRKTGTCAKHQRQLAVAIKRARHLALIPFTEEHARLSGRN
jgi:small subunit ribosomal protein S18